MFEFVPLPRDGIAMTFSFYLGPVIDAKHLYIYMYSHLYFTRVLVLAGRVVAAGPSDLQSFVNN
jgi:hypothetical protein